MEKFKQKFSHSPQLLLMLMSSTVAHYPPPELFLRVILGAWFELQDIFLLFYLVVYVYVFAVCSIYFLFIFYYYY